MAERNVVDLRRRLASAERLRDRAISAALFVKTPSSRSSEPEWAATSADHFLFLRIGGGSPGMGGPHPAEEHASPDGVPGEAAEIGAFNPSTSIPARLRDRRGLQSPDAAV